MKNLKTTAASQELDTRGCYYFVGAVIRQAILDYWNKNSSNYNAILAHEDALRFIDSKRLELFLDKFRISGLVNSRMIRHVAHGKKLYYFQHEENYAFPRRTSPEKNN